MISLQEIREIVDFFVLDMCSKPIFCSKIALKGKTCWRLLKPQKVAPNAKSCSKVAEHNRDRPSYPTLSRLHGKMWPRLTGLPYLADRLGGLPHLSCKHDQIKIRDCMERRVTSPNWGPPPPCKQALKGRTIRKVMGGVGKKTPKKSCKGKCQEKKFVQRRS